MRESFCVFTENGDEITVDFSIVKDEKAERPYGIYSYVRGNREDSALAEQRFYTYGEAVAVVDMLCRNEVTPCTLCDII